VRWLATACLAAVCVQGLLGGLRVDLINLPLAMVHGCFAQATFCLMVTTAAVTGRAWGKLPAEAGSPVGRVRGLAYLTVGVVFAQLIVAAVMRHLGAGLAIPDLPLTYGHWLPPTTAEQLATDNAHRLFDLGLPRVTMTQVWLHFTHRIGAVVVSATALTLLAAIFTSARRSRSLVNPAIALGVLLVTQVTLGLLTVYFRKPADIASSHVACGALVLATAVLIAVRASRLYVLRSPAPAVEATATVPGVLVAV
jgi:cytochrome c oxidase assembly protein subunit 15